MNEPAMLALDGFVATLLAISLVYTRKTINSVKGQTEKPWIVIFFSNAAFLVGSLLQFYSDLVGGYYVSPFLISAVPASILLVTALVYGYRYVIGNNLLLEHLVGELKKHGFAAKRDAKLTGRSGAEHIFDVVAKRDDLTIVMDVKSSLLEVGEIPVLQLFMKTLDTAVSHPVLVATPGVGRTARKFTTMYRITVVEGRTHDVLIRELGAFLENLKPAAAEGGRRSLGGLAELESSPSEAGR